MVKYLFVIIIIVLIISYIYVFKNPLIEGYDARFINISLPECANFCRTTAGCQGFGYDKTKNICYPAALNILGRPLNSIFKEEYTYNNTTCNKMKAIDEPTNKPGFADRRSNSVFICSETHEQQPQYYFFNKGDFKNIGEGKEIDNIFDVDVYKVKKFRWPIDHFDYNQQDLLVKEKENQTYTPSNITDLDRVIQSRPPFERVQPIIKPTVRIHPTWDFELDKKLSKAREYVKNLTPKQQDKIEKRTEKKTFRGNKYTINNNYNDGEYHCVKNIHLFDCLNACSASENCAGVEWNPSYNTHQNVCCPYKNIGNLIPRNPDKKSGTFYQKVGSRPS